MIVSLYGEALRSYCRPCGRITKLDQSGLSSIDATSLMTCQRQLADDRVPLKAMRWFYDESKDDGSPLIRKLPRIPFYQGAKLLQNLGTVNAFILSQHFQIGIGIVVFHLGFWLFQGGTASFFLCGDGLFFSYTCWSQ
ncbi:hypothetical protein LOK49_LG09G01611 [Camellia lanceoleosa]|uniref:Uncharacterized protein n=1 Tax=Camellia lanceoleosa TaxID=1840588 RepID=A0ACC0GQ40_9ERIC|nr:hypothetical protein LOK49_LG09G01611 [Camellia lanceoleosa]